MNTSYFMKSTTVNVNKLFNYVMFMVLLLLYLNILFAEMNPCGDEPCLNGGECIEDFPNYICKCKPGYSGNNCESGGSSGE